MLPHSRLFMAGVLVWLSLPAHAARALPPAALAGGAGVESTPKPRLESSHLVLSNTFHLVGVPGVKRNRRVDLDLSSDSLVVRKDGKERLSIPFSRLRRLDVLNGKRTYAKATYAAVVTFGVGGLLALTRNKSVDTLVFDFVNERGGEMGLILQVPQGKGADCIQWLRRYGIQAEEPEPLPDVPSRNPQP